jgi:hypothetical protein
MSDDPHRMHRRRILNFMSDFLMHGICFEPNSSPCTYLSTETRETEAIEKNSGTESILSSVEIV